MDLSLPQDERYMQRCLDLARLGQGWTRSNPMVGAVLVHQGRILSEGYHERFAEAHAEVRCLDQVSAADRSLIPFSTLYVNLEPCSHQGKTPPCADRIVKEGVARVVVGTEDPNPLVAGSGLNRLKAAGIQLRCGVLPQASEALNRRFFQFHRIGRPFVVLKWAQTPDGYWAHADGHPMKISHPWTDRLVHRWRSEEMAILLGWRTVQSDNPRLDNRWWVGPPPLRVILDPHGSLPQDCRVLQPGQPTWVFTHLKPEIRGSVEWIQVPASASLPGFVLQTLAERQVLSVLVEGGSRTLRGFMEAGLWDEARLITGSVAAAEGLLAPHLTGGQLLESLQVQEDRIDVYRNRHDANDL